jgi:hypothetical protein
MVGKLMTKIDDNNNNGNRNRRNCNRPNLECKEPCQHCKTVHTKPDNECWELGANAASRPKGKKSRKAT